jgi:hypothetical protein
MKVPRWRKSTHKLMVSVPHGSREKRIDFSRDVRKREVHWRTTRWPVESSNKYGARGGSRTRRTFHRWIVLIHLVDEDDGIWENFDKYSELRSSQWLIILRF